jgi:hypothetical protein
MGAEINVLDRLARRLETAHIWEIMRDDERDQGRTVVLPGDRPWFSADEWHWTNVVSIDGRKVRLIAVSALNPGCGAFHRLVAGIVDAQLEPVVIEPFEQMQKILKRWGWKHRMAGAGTEREEQWRPRLGWRPRALLSLAKTQRQLSWAAAKIGNIPEARRLRSDAHFHLEHARMRVARV